MACGDVETDGLKMFIKIQRTGVVVERKKKRSDQVGEHHHTFHEGRRTPHLPTYRALHYVRPGSFTEDVPYSSRVPNNGQQQLMTQEL